MRKLLIMVALIAALLVPGIARVGARTSRSAPMRLVHVVEPGETLWGIARKLEPGTDARRTVDRLVKANRLGRGAVRPGQPLYLPAR